jgi:hypothetical protein
VAAPQRGGASIADNWRMDALLRLIAEDLRDYASGDLPVTPEALRHLAAVLDDLCEESDCGHATTDVPVWFRSSRA